MRIGVFDPYLDDLGGGEKYMIQLASDLSLKHDVTIFWDTMKDVDAVKKRFSINLEKIKVSKNIFSPKISFLERAKAFRNFDTFIILSDGSIPFVFPKKLYLHIQQPLPKHHRSFKDKVKQKHISAIFYNSQFTQKFNNPLFPGVRSTVIYPPVSLVTKVEGLGLSSKKNIILHVGRFRVKSLANEDYKKQGFMIDSFKQLVDRGFENWEFHLASSVKQEDEEAFEALRNNAKGYAIEFHINRTNRELSELYSSAKIYWHASGYGEDIERHPELAEHFGITTVEAMSAGVVPVVINSGGQKEIVTDGENGLLWNTSDELLEKTNHLASDDQLWNKLSKKAQIRAQDYSEKRFYDEVQRLITE